MTETDRINDIAADLAFIICKIPEGPSKLEEVTKLIAEAMRGLND